MRVRELDNTHDWTFGKGRNNYLRDRAATMQNINTRLQSFLGDCFFDAGAGIDWFNLLGTKDQVSLNLAVSAVILNTIDVTGIEQLSVELSQQRLLEIKYQVQTSYGPAFQTFQFDLTA